MRVTLSGADIVLAVLVSALAWQPLHDLMTDRPCDHTKLTITMRAEDVIKACGKPKRIETNLNFDGRVTEQWVYSVWGRSYVYLTNGSVSTIQWRDPVP